MPIGAPSTSIVTIDGPEQAVGSATAPNRVAHGAGRRTRRRTHELRWRVIRDEPRPGATNMARDHALAECLSEGEGAVRLYGWSGPTVSFGKNEPAVAPVAGLDYVRRPTGGRAVLHEDELTYAVVAPPDAFGGLRQAYVGVNRALAGALASLGAAVEVAGDAETAPGAVAALDSGACFRSPVKGEIVSRGRKLVGSAQARLDGALLQHGSVLLSGDQRLAGMSDADPVTLSELLGNVNRDSVIDAAADALRRAFGGIWEESMYRSRELEAADRLVAERYGLDTWTWRR